MFEIVESNPVAKFYYKGSHGHHIKRTVVIIEADKKKITGYELREGNTVRSLKSAPVKTYLRCKIAKVNQVDKRSTVRKYAEDSTKSTFSRKSIFDLIINGI